MHTIKNMDPDTISKMFAGVNAGDDFIKAFFPAGCTLLNLFSDCTKLQPGEWSKDVHIMKNIGSDEYEQSDSIKIRLYRKPFDKNDKVSDDEEAEQTGNWAGRLTILMFYSDNGDFVGPCIDCGLPDRYRTERTEEKTSNLTLTYEERLFLSDVLLNYQAMLQYSRQTMFGNALVAVTEQMNEIAALNKKILNVDEQKRNDYMDFITDLKGYVCRVQI